MKGKIQTSINDLKTGNLELRDQNGNIQKDKDGETIYKYNLDLNDITALRSTVCHGDSECIDNAFFDLCTKQQDFRENDFKIAFHFSTRSNAGDRRTLEYKISDENGEEIESESYDSSYIKNDDERIHVSARYNFHTSQVWDKSKSYKLRFNGSFSPENGGSNCNVYAVLLNNICYAYEGKTCGDTPRTKSFSELPDEGGPAITFTAFDLDENEDKNEDEDEIGQYFGETDKTRITIFAKCDQYFD